MKIVKKNHLKIVIFTAVKYRCILYGNVYVMRSRSGSAVFAKSAIVMFGALGLASSPKGNDRSSASQQ